jgi:hypothetical protein
VEWGPAGSDQKRGFAGDQPLRSWIAAIRRVPIDAQERQLPVDVQASPFRKRPPHAFVLRQARADFLNKVVGDRVACGVMTCYHFLNVSKTLSAAEYSALPTASTCLWSASPDHSSMKNFFSSIATQQTDSGKVS